MHETAENHRSLTPEQLYGLMQLPFSGRLVFPSDVKTRKIDTHAISQYIGGAKFCDLENQPASLAVLFETEQCKGTSRDREHALLVPQFLDEHSKTWFNHHILCIHVRKTQLLWPFEETVIGSVYQNRPMTDVIRCLAPSRSVATSPAVLRDDPTHHSRLLDKGMLTDTNWHE